MDMTSLWNEYGMEELNKNLAGFFPDIEWNMKELFERKKILKPIGSIATFLFITLFWMLIRTRDLSSLEVIFGNITIGKPLQYYLTSQTLINLELPIILAFIALVLV